MAEKTATADKIHNALRRLEQKANVAGYIILDAKGEHVGTVRVSYPRDGAGKLIVLAADWTSERPMDGEGKPDFTNWTPWQYGWAMGYGYDKRTAAMGGMTIAGVTLKDQGKYWHDQLREAGLQVIQAI